jgi:carbon storage regulator
MLVLSRQRDEEIMIGSDIYVAVVDIRGDKVRLGITAPKDVSVHRREVYDAIQRENRRADKIKPGLTDKPAAAPVCVAGQLSRLPVMLDMPGGDKRPGVVLECPTCRGTSFTVMRVRDCHHDHLYCAACDRSFPYVRSNGQ